MVKLLGSKEVKLTGSMEGSKTNKFEEHVYYSSLLKVHLPFWQSIRPSHRWLGGRSAFTVIDKRYQKALYCDNKVSLSPNLVRATLHMTNFAWERTKYDLGQSTQNSFECRQTFCLVNIQSFTVHIEISMSGKYQTFLLTKLSPWFSLTRHFVRRDQIPSLNIFKILPTLI